MSEEGKRHRYYNIADPDDLKRFVRDSEKEVTEDLYRELRAFSLF